MNAHAKTVGDVAMGVAGWLARTIRPDATAHRSALSRALALAEVCRLVRPQSVSTTAELVSGILERITVEDLIATELLTALLAAAVIVRAKEAGPAPGVFAYLGLLEDLAGRTLDDANGVLARIALRGEDRARGGPGEPLTYGEARLLRLDESRCDPVLEQVEMRSAYGTIDVRWEAPLNLMLEGTALGAFRRYDLPRGMRALRARCYLDPSWSLGIGSGFEFIRTSMCADGSFGDYDGATIALREAGLPADLLELKLPVTFQALWTLAEVDDRSFRLAARAFSGGLLREGQKLC